MNAELLKQFIEDIAQRGLKCDTNPTLHFSGDENAMYAQWKQYLERQQEILRQSAQDILKVADSISCCWDKSTL